MLEEGDILLLRHGESEGNAANRLNEDGEQSSHSELYATRHSYHLRLSLKGCEQALSTNRWLAKNNVSPDNFVVSEYTRAKETAYLIGLPNALWTADRHLIERDWGKLERLTPSERWRLYGPELRARSVEPFYWRPDGGETMEEVCARVKMFLLELVLRKPRAKTIVVCHGEVMWAFRIVLENLSVKTFADIHLLPDSHRKIWNCQMLHYTWHSPSGMAQTTKGLWCRTIRPTVEPALVTEWKEIKPVSYTNEQLLAEVALHPRHFGEN